MGGAVSSVTGAVGGLIGGVTQPLAEGITGISGYGPGAYNDSYSRSKQQIDRYNNIETSYRNRAKQDYKYSYDALKQLQSAAEGKGPSQAEGVLQKGLDQGLQAQMAMANSASPSQSMGSQKRAMDNAALMTQDTANQASILRAQEMATARQQYSAAAQSLYGQNSATAANYAGMSGSLIGGNMSGAAGMYGSGIGAQAAAIGGLFSGAGAGTAAYFLKSDKDKKKEIEPPKDEEIDGFLAAIKPLLYEYKNPTGEKGATPGEHLGIIAQELEKTPVGKSLVVDSPEGKLVDIPSTVGTLLATSARLHERLAELEEYFKKSKDKKKKEDK